jgi:hypothetical protein
MKLRRCVAGALFATTTGCTTLHSVSPESFITAEQPRQVIVFEEDGDVYVVDNPRIVGDSLVGLDTEFLSTVALPLTDVVEVWVRRKSATRTLLLAGGVVAAAAAVVLVARTTTGCKPVPNDPARCDEIQLPDIRARSISFTGER